MLSKLNSGHLVQTKNIIYYIQYIYPYISTTPSNKVTNIKEMLFVGHTIILDSNSQFDTFIT